jgi:PAS domain S-box-containing protein/putative nucleotidyltransferase with HDIG domain
MTESKRILIVEDEEGLAITLTFLLKRMHYAPIEALARGEDAVEKAGQLAPDLVLMDINLAGQMDGIEAARLIRERHGIPVIFLTALAEDDTIQQAVGSEPFAYLVKPVKEPDLRAAIDIALFKHNMEARLRESETRYRLLFETMRSGFGLGEIVVDAAGKPCDFRTLALNPTYARMLDLREEDCIGRNASEVLLRFDLRFYVEVYGRVALTGDSEEFERFVPEIGRFLHFIVYSPRPGQFASLVEDVTERKLAEQSLKESETRFRQLAEGVSEVFWLRQRSDGRILYVSPAYERVFGHKCEELYSNPASFIDCIHTEDRARVVSAQKAMQNGGPLFNEEYRIIRPDGRERWIWARTFPVREDNGEVSRFSGIAEDITDRRRAEEKLRESYRRLERSLHRMTALRNVDLAITTHTDQASMVSAILKDVVESSEIDAAVMFVPNLPQPGRLRSTGPLSALRLAGIAGVSDDALDGAALSWQMLMVNHVFQSCQPLYINDLCQDPHPGAQSLQRAAGFRSCAVLPLLARGQSKGVLQFFHRSIFPPDVDWQTFLQSLALQAAIGIDHVEMLENLKRTNRELASAYDETIKGWAQALELRDKETRGHSDRVSEMSVRLAASLGLAGEALDHIRRGAFLHDIGKMAITDSILLKTGPLNQDEWVTMRQHPKIGYQLLSNIEYLRPALDIVYCHHERWDGSGYPRGLKGEEIPLAARIFAVVDVWDALTDNRPYRLAWPLDEVRAYLRKESGRHFDPRIVVEFLKLIA